MTVYFTKNDDLMGVWVIPRTDPGSHIRAPAHGPHKILTSFN